MDADPSDVQRQLAWEALWRTRAAAAAAGAGLLIIVATAIQFAVVSNEPTVGVVQALHPLLQHPPVANPAVSPKSAELAYIAHHATPELVAAIISTIAAVGLGGALLFLYGAAKSRRPEMPSAARPLAIAGAAGAGLVGVGLQQAGLITQVAIVIKFNDFVHGADHSHHAVDQARSGVVGVLGTLALLPVPLVLASAFVLIALNAMRVGLLTRFLGVLGIICGVLFVIPLAPLPILQVFWLLALAMLFSGRWPNGTPPAWETGRPEPWPSQQQVREQREAARRERQGLPPPEPAPSGPDLQGAPPPSPAVHPSSKKRKRKRRR
jgi:hypothetical protein